MQRNTKLCKHCSGPLKPIGHARANGKCHNDWASRDLHKKCFKEVEETNKWIKYRDQILDIQKRNQPIL